MSGLLEAAVSAINGRLGPEPLSNSIKFQINGEGAVVVDQNGARIGDDETDCTLIASAKTFEGILKGEVNPAMAVMTRKLKIEGDMSVALKLGALLG